LVEKILEEFQKFLEPESLVKNLVKGIENINIFLGEVEKIERIYKPIIDEN
jgi:hypothetical protein